MSEFGSADRRQHHKPGLLECRLAAAREPPARGESDCQAEMRGDRDRLLGVIGARVAQVAQDTPQRAVVKNVTRIIASVRIENSGRILLW